MLGKLNGKQIIYLLFALVGGGYTFFLVMQGVVAHQGSFSVVEFAKSTWIDDYYAKSISMDFLTVAICATLFMVVEGLRLQMKYLWVYIILTFTIALAFAFPLFLLMREFKLRENSSS
jgi:hypothetical protein